jgi:uncharacterized protein (DUF362 family)
MMSNQKCRALACALALGLSALAAGAAEPQQAPMAARPFVEPDGSPVVGIAKGGDYASVVHQAIENAGGLAGIVKPGDVVLIKPNLCIRAAPGDPKTTDYRVVQAIVDAVKLLKASRIVIAEGSFYGNALSPSAAAACKYDSIQGVELFDFNSCDKKDCYELKPERSLLGKSVFIPKIYMDADVVIEAPKLKTHFLPEAVVSLSVKNVFGVPSEKIYGGYGDKMGLHAFPLSQIIVDLNMIRKPDFSVIDGIVGGEGQGPVYNTPVKSEIVIAGRDPVAVDTVGLTFMGFTLDQVPHLKLAAKERLGIADLGAIKVVGADLAAIKMNFKSNFKRAKQ